eukprot:TRINITY_DN38715_c0_g1_i1.p1 TRINITY_DN38715_c0_g1~~TRINITY_DN38715_c0_g1_i1.p1  ORF type:complete len:231 (+),score=44.10 TRINITY_DN38715_c0_g1_i1:292-984(+)
MASSPWTTEAVTTGTTIMATTYKGGVVLGADSRVCTGAYISNRSSAKISPLTDNAYICRSGSAADTQLVYDYARYYLEQHEVEKGAPADVKTVANLAMQISYHNKKMLQAGMIVAGWDKYAGGSVYGLPIGGTMLKLPFATGGSGSTYIFGFCDQAFKEDMTQEEAEAFVVKAVALAMARDGSSGGFVRTVTVNEKGATKKMFAGEKLPLFHEELPPVDSLLSIRPIAAS